MAVLAAVAVLLVAAGELAAQSADSAIPTYTETDLTARVGLTQPGAPMKTTDDGLVVLVDHLKEGAQLKYLDSSGATVKSFPLAVAGDVSAFCIDPAGNIGVFASDAVKGKTADEITAMKRSVVLFTRDGKKLKTVDLGQVPWDKGNPWYLVDVATDSRGTIFAGTSKGIEVFDAQGKPGRQLASYRPVGLDVDAEGKLYAVGYSTTDYKSFLEKIDPATGKRLWRADLGDMPVTMRLNRKAKTISVLDARYVSSWNTEGNLLGRVFAMKDSSVDGQYVYGASFTVDPAGNVYFISRKPAASQDDPWTWVFLKYSRSAQAVQKKNTLTISHGYWYDRYPDAAISAFQKKNPGWKVEFLRTIEENDMSGGDSYDQILASVATELMAGRGADIVSLAYTPYPDFIEKGLLVNLDQLAASDKSFSMPSLRQNILEPFRSRGALYVMPVNFAVDVLFASKKVLDEARVSINEATWQWEDFFAVADKVRKDTNGDGVPDRFALPAMDASQVFRGYVLRYGLDAWYNRDKKQARLADPGFIALLKATKSFAERNAQKNPFGQEKWVEGAQNGSLVFFINSLTGPLDPQSYGALFKGEAQVFGLPGSGALGDQAWSGLIVGINRNSRNQQMAWEFLKLLVSEEIQQGQNLFAVPVNTAAYAKKVQLWKDVTARGQAGGGFGQGSNFTFAPLSDKDIATVERVFSRVKRTSYTDRRLSGILGAELKDFFAGTRSAEDACESLQQKVMTYLQE